jgi:DNA-binding NarL/FixJ family response regulator
MPNLDGLGATKALLADHQTSPKVLILTTFGMNEHVFEALEAGASGFLLKDSPPEDLVSAVKVIARGDALLDPKVTRAVIGSFVKQPQSSHWEKRLQQLTAREREVLKLIAQGLTNAEMADQLVISPGTVKTHVANILMKLQVRDRVHAVIAAFDSGFTTTRGDEV